MARTSRLRPHDVYGSPQSSIGHRGMGRKTSYPSSPIMARLSSHRLASPTMAATESRASGRWDPVIQSAKLSGPAEALHFAPRFFVGILRLSAHPTPRRAATVLARTWHAELPWGLPSTFGAPNSSPSLEILEVGGI
ncbi:hypothetical protein VMCG_07485 [Cytospora schulzeri]|uniref:Uncharacterized protein n=1 Tax=Cytospora schulzeri TaxID=448051 RepID=A0A423W158_9PEZI|nr:hypothetical protein VMCG_07485 [Valsa malicola]